MRIALVSPYSWTYPGGVTRHIEALAEQFLEVEVRGGDLFNKPHPFDLVEAFQVTCALCGKSGPRARDLALAYLHQHVTEHHLGEEPLRVVLTLERG